VLSDRGKYESQKGVDSLTETNDPDLDRVVETMRMPRPGREYFAMTLLATEDGEMVIDVATQYAAPHPERTGWELREGRLVSSKLFELVYGVGNYLVVEEPEQLRAWLERGGPALVEEAIGREAFPTFVEPSPSVPHPSGGHRDPERLPRQATRRRPYKALRRAVMERDEHRCRMCGRDADYSIDIRLLLHHVRPWAIGGLTELPNLITLCQACHDSLKPHYDFSLIFEAAPPLMPDPERWEEEQEEIRRYREIARKGYDDDPDE
jgi:5-methylcytosine-specific restriction endonuclease McrA